MAFLPWHTIGVDEIIRFNINDSVTPHHSILHDLGIEQGILEDQALQYVRGYRDSLYYEMAQEEAQSWRDKAREPKGRVYHTI